MCDHFFEPKEERETATCLGSHYVRCSKCDVNYFKYYQEFLKKYFQENPSRCKDDVEHKKILDQETHIHIWDKQEDGKYKCINSVYDWEKSEPEKGFYMSKNCGQILA